MVTGLRMTAVRTVGAGLPEVLIQGLVTALHVGHCAPCMAMLVIALNRLMAMMKNSRQIVMMNA